MSSPIYVKSVKISLIKTTVTPDFTGIRERFTYPSANTYISLFRLVI